MAKSARAGELRTRITVCDRTLAEDSNGYDQPSYSNIYADGRALHCRWQNVHGSDALEAEKLGYQDAATLTTRYDRRITPTCVIYRVGDGRPYEIVSLDNVENAGKYLEIRVKRMVEAK